MKTILLLLCTLLSFSTFAVSKKFIRSIESIEFITSREKLYRGNTIELEVFVTTYDGIKHNLRSSKKIKLRDFDFVFSGDCKLVSKSKGKITLELTKEVKLGTFEAYGILKKDNNYFSQAVFEIRDYRKEVEAIHLPGATIKAGSSFKPSFSVKLRDGKTLNVNEYSNKLFISDFTFDISGSASKLDDSGRLVVDKIIEEFPFVNCKVSLKSNWKISKEITYDIDFGVNYSLDFNARGGWYGDDGRDGDDGSCGRRYDRFDSERSSRCKGALSGEAGEDGRAGRDGRDGATGRNAGNYRVGVSLKPIPMLNDSLLHVFVEKSDGITRTFLIDKNSGKVIVKANGGTGGNGGDGGDGGNGGNGGKGKSSTTESPKSGWGGDAGNGGDGGDAGNGGDGGDGGTVTVFYSKEAAPYLDRIVIYVNGGRAGAGGSGGDGGRAGCKGNGGKGKGRAGDSGYDGSRGYSGRPGRNGVINYQLMAR